MSVLLTPGFLMELTICLDTPVYPYIEPYPLQAPEMLSSGIERPSAENVHEDFRKVVLTEGVASTPNNPETTGGCIPIPLTTPINEDPGMLCTESRPETTTVESMSLNNSAIVSRIPHSMPQASQKAMHIQLSESTAEKPSQSVTSTGDVRPAVFRRFSASPASYSISGRGLPENPATGRPFAGVGRPVTRFSIGSVCRPLQEVSVSFAGDALGRSNPVSEAAPTDRPPVRRRDSLVWQKARAFDDKSEFSLSFHLAHH
jgi:hypothetical protein